MKGVKVERFSSVLKYFLILNSTKTVNSDFIVVNRTDESNGQGKRSKNLAKFPEWE